MTTAQMIWMAQDVIIALVGVVIVPIAAWRLTQAAPKPLQLPLLSGAVLLFLSGLSHISWDFVPANIPTHVYATHTITAIGSLIMCAVLLRNHDKMREAMRLEGDDLFKSAFNYAAIGMAIVGRNGSWLRVNDALCTLLGYSREELLRLTFQNITHPDDLAQDVEYVRRMLEGEIDTYTMSKRYIRKDGSEVPVLLSVSATHNRAGDIELFMSQIQDRSEIAVKEEALRTAIRERDELIDAMSSRVTRSVMEASRWSKHNA